MSLFSALAQFKSCPTTSAGRSCTPSRLLVESLEPRLLLSATWSQQAKLIASDAAAADRFGIDLSIFGDTAVVGAVDHDDAGSGSGSAYVYVRSGTTWTEQAKLTASDAAAGDLFGLVSIFDDTIVVGATQETSLGPGAAYVFVRDNNGSPADPSDDTWSEQAKLTASDGAISDSFGNRVSISGDTILVGAVGDDDAGSSSGSAYVFVRSGTTWTEQAKLTASDAAGGDSFGFDVAVDGDTVLVAAPRNDAAGSLSGSAYVFVRSGTTWTEQAKLTASDAAADDRFGSSVEIDGDTVVVGAPFNDDAGSSSGSAYVFVRSGTTWTEQAKLTASDAAAGDEFALVSIFDDTIVVGAAFNDNSGSAYVFERSGTTWTEQAKLTASDGAGDDRFGSKVSISGDTVLVGSLFDDDGGSNSGSAYVFALEDATSGFVYWSTAQHNGPSVINRANLDGSGIQTIIAGTSSVRYGGIAIDDANGHLYSGDGSGLFRANLDGTGKTTLTSVLATGNTVADVELDLVNGKVYWSDLNLAAAAPNRGIRRADLDGSNVETIIALGSNQLVEGLAVDPTGGKIYYAAPIPGINDGSIRFANLDGTGDTVFKTLGPGRTDFEVEIDQANGKLYWNEGATSKSIWRTNLDGSGALELVFAPPGGLANGIHYDEVNDKIYFPSGTGLELNRIDSDGTGLELVVSEPLIINYMEVSHFAVNQDPVVDNLTFEVQENAIAGSSVGIVLATDPDPGDILTYEITSGNEAGAFAIDSSTGEITVADSSPLDFETTTSFALTVQVEDDAGQEASATVTIDVLNQASITGVVFVDVNGNNLFDANEVGIDGVTIELLDASGSGTGITATTSDGGYYQFEDLDPDTYQLHEIQPTGIDDGAESLGNLGGIILPLDTMQLTLARTDASDYAFAEIGQQLSSGDTATIGFWQNKHGQALIDAGGPALANWLTTNFSNVFGDVFDSTTVADFYKQQLFKQKGNQSNGPAKVDAQFMAVTLATYFTSSNLSGNVGASYGFNVTQTGIGTNVFNVGSSGAAFGVADGTDLSIMQLLAVTNALTSASGGFSSIYDGDAALRAMANEIYTAINEGGHI